MRFLLSLLLFLLTAVTPLQAGEWPKPIKEFLAGDYLEYGDIVLTRREFSPTSAFIMWATDAKFSHSAVVFASPSEPGFDNTFIIEAIATGVDITDLGHYLRERGSVVAIKRFRGDWYKNAHKARVRGLLLDKIRADYAYGTLVKIGKDILFDIQRNWYGFKEAVKNFKENDWKPPNEFICSGLIQVSLVEAVSEFIVKRELPPWTLNQIVFDPEVRKLLPSKEDWQKAPPTLIDDYIPVFRKLAANDLESVTPAMIAESENFEWLYLIKDGKVHKVDNTTQVRKLMAE